jgi:hypothetical protein
LIQDKRLFIPEHVIREFLRNREIKISELFTSIDSLLSSLPNLKEFEYPVLGEIESYKLLKETRDKIKDDVKKYKQYLNDLKIGITNWNWTDPLSLTYSEIFSENILIKNTEKEEELIKEYDERLLNGIPPGNKDSSKEDNALGDFLIWKCILSIGTDLNKNVIFITNDEKNDWMVKGNKQSISTKYELVDEFYRITNGNEFICMTFSMFLEKQGLDIHIEEFFNISQSKSNLSSLSKNTGSLDSLKECAILLKGINLSDESVYDETNYISSEDLNPPLNYFLNTWKDEFYNSPEWTTIHSKLYILHDLLSEIKNSNGIIEFQFYRQKQDTRTEQIKLQALVKAFFVAYEKNKFF